MSHQPYETWLLDPGELTPQQAAELQAHLETCETCSGLQAAWQEVHSLIQSAQEVPAPAGFRQRFTASLEERKTRERIRQIRRTLFLLGGGIVLFSLAVLGVAIAIVSPAELLLRGIEAVTAATRTWDQIGEFFQFFLRVAPPALTIFLGLALASWVLILSLTWVFTWMRFSVKGEENR